MSLRREALLATTVLSITTPAVLDHGSITLSIHESWSTDRSRNDADSIKTRFVREHDSLFLTSSNRARAPMCCFEHELHPDSVSISAPIRVSIFGCVDPYAPRLTYMWVLTSGPKANFVSFNTCYCRFLVGVYALSQFNTWENAREG